MYIPEIYKNQNVQEVRDFIRKNAFGILVTHKDGKSCATHIPLILDTLESGQEILHAHISKANEQVAHLEDGAEVLCIYNGPHAYVSSSWYNFEEVPTWNYIAVQVRGTIKRLDSEGLHASVNALMKKYEVGQKNPVKMEHLSPKTMRQIHGIIGFEVHITSVEAAYKLSQNRDDKNHSAIVGQLENGGDPQETALADAMKSERSKKQE